MDDESILALTICMVFPGLDNLDAKSLGYQPGHTALAPSVATESRIRHVTKADKFKWV